jgi:hypothetical protein
MESAKEFKDQFSAAQAKAQRQHDESIVETSVG